MITAIDFGTGAALAIHGPDGPVAKPKLPRVPGGKTPADDFIRLLPIFLEDGDVVVESPTVGSSGVEPAEVAQIVGETPHRLLLVSARAVKNYRLDHDLQTVKSFGKYEIPANPTDQPTAHESDAEIIYRIATETPQHLREWRWDNDKLERVHTSVRPHDKRKYRGETPDAYMARLPGFESLPVNLQTLLGQGTADPAKGTNHPGQYSRAKAMPFAMSLDEPGTETRDGWEKVMGLYGHGYPSFYRRATVVLMQDTAKRMADVSRIAEVPRETRKKAWKQVRRDLRQLYHLMMT